jgi:hypothetical protein
MSDTNTPGPSGGVTPEECAELARLCEAAPDVQRDDKFPRLVARTNAQAFYAAARTLVPTLTAALARAEQERDAARRRTAAALHVATVVGTEERAEGMRGYNECHRWHSAREVSLVAQFQAERDAAVARADAAESNAAAKIAAICSALSASEAKVAAVEAERDAYKRAKAENDERFCCERDDARAERDAARAEARRLAGRLEKATCFEWKDASGAHWTVGCPTWRETPNEWWVTRNIRIVVRDVTLDAAFAAAERAAAEAGSDKTGKSKTEESK